ncbi:MAG: hypothetical protein JW793_08925 [Acidobacteria bacterium]|nr:hypothetical protein [Acidobacteriota bacterium]
MATALKEVTKPEPQPDVIGKALTLFSEKAALRKRRRDSSKEFSRAEAALKRAAGDLEREEKRKKNGDQAANPKAAKNWHAHVEQEFETAKSEVEDIDRSLEGLDLELSTLDIEPIRTEFESLSRESKLISRRLKRAFYDDTQEEREAQARQEEIDGRLKILEPALSDVEALQAAARHKKELADQATGINKLCDEYESRLSEAVELFVKLRDTPCLRGQGIVPDGVFLILASSQHLGEAVKERIEEKLSS